MADYTFSDASDTVSSATTPRLGSGDRINLGGGNDVALLAGIDGLIVNGGRGADLIEGENLTLFFDNIDSISLIDLKSGRIVDRNGVVDTIIGSVANLELPEGAALVIGDAGTQSYLYSAGGSHTIIGGGGRDVLSISDSPKGYRGYTDLDGSKILINTVSGDSIRLTDVDIEFKNWQPPVFLGTDGGDVVRETSLSELTSIFDLTQQLPVALLGKGPDHFTVSQQNRYRINTGPGNDTIDASSLTGSVFVFYNTLHGADASPSGIQFSAADSKAIVKDGWGDTDILIGNDWFLYGTSHGDTIQLAQGQVYAGHGDDLIISTAPGNYVVPGPGSDTLMGSFKLSLGEGPNPDLINLRLNTIIDGSGAKDLVIGQIEIIYLGSNGSSVIGSSGTDHLSLPGMSGGAHFIDGGGGYDIVEIQGEKSNFLVDRHSTREVNIHSKDGLSQYSLLNIESISFANRDTVPTGFELFSKEATLDGAPYVSSFSSGGRIDLAGTIEFIDFTGDNQPELITHWSTVVSQRFSE